MVVPKYEKTVELKDFEEETSRAISWYSIDKVNLHLINGYWERLFFRENDLILRLIAETSPDAFKSPMANVSSG